MLRRTGSLLIRVANRAYTRSLPALSVEERKLVRANERFRNCHAGKRCFVIGNGPSLTSQDLAPLAEELTFVTNGFVKHPIVEHWQPNYYFFTDHVWFDGSESTKAFFQLLRSRVYASHFFVPSAVHEVIETQKVIPLESTSFVAFDGSWKDQIDITERLTNIDTVIQLAIMTAVHMGCSPIYLLGVDHDWLANRHSGHYNFYPGKTLSNHPVAIGEFETSYEQDMVTMVRLWREYRRLGEVAEKMGTRILNATHGGFLDVFDRVNYESLFEPEKYERSANNLVEKAIIIS